MTLAWLSPSKGRLPVFSIESSAQAHRAARDIMSGCDGVHLCLGDSVATLRRTLAAGEFPDRDVLCYLDAHWQEKLPLADEIETVTTTMTDFVVLIDDFQVKPTVDECVCLFGIVGQQTNLR